MKPRVLLVFGLLGAIGCQVKNVLGVPAPVGFVSSGAVNSPASALQAFAVAREEVFQALSQGRGSSLIEMSGMMSDEMTDEGGLGGFFNNYWLFGVDARRTTKLTSSPVTIGEEPGDFALKAILAARSDLLATQGPLVRNTTGADRARIGEMYALVGYAELFLAEDYCAGVPLSQSLFGGGISYGKPLTNDSLFGVAEAHFDSALAQANGNDTVADLASVGLGRVRLDRGRPDSAASAVTNVSTTFVYNIQGGNTQMEANNDQTTFYVFPLYISSRGCGDFQTADREGRNGLNFRSATDPRLQFDTTAVITCDATIYGLSDSVWYLPRQFTNGTIPMATGVEARLIEAEAALSSGDANTWATDLNALRTNAPSTYLNVDSAFHALTVDSTINASARMQIDVMFRERAFWLFGTGTRLGDLRRLVRQYQIPADSVFPTGTYAPSTPSVGLPSPIFPSGTFNYGTDVSFTLPTAASGLVTGNPYYQGCTSPASTP